MIPVREKMIYRSENQVRNNGAQGGTRTHTVLLPKDFKSSASTISPPGQRILIIVDFEPVMPHEMPHQLTNPKPQNQR